MGTGAPGGILLDTLRQFKTIFTLFGEKIASDSVRYGTQIPDSVKNSCERVELLTVYMIARFSGCLGTKKEMNEREFVQKRTRTEKGLMPIKVDEEHEEWLTFCIVTVCFFIAMRDETRSMVSYDDASRDKQDWAAMCGKFIPEKYNAQWVEFSACTRQFNTMQVSFLEKIGWNLNLTSEMLWWSDEEELPSQMMPLKWILSEKAEAAQPLEAKAEPTDLTIQTVETKDPHTKSVQEYVEDGYLYIPKNEWLQGYNWRSKGKCVPRVKRARVCPASATSLILFCQENMATFFQVDEDTSEGMRFRESPTPTTTATPTTQEIRDECST
jgi:hypothetical protein